MKRYKIWIQYSLIVIISLVVLISLFNYKIDSLSIFGNSKYLNQASKTLLSDKMIAGLKNYDERLFQKYIIADSKEKRDIILLGSSRTMVFRKKFLREKNATFFNHSVSGASLDDFIAIVGLYESIAGYLPHHIIIGIDDWMLNKNYTPNRWKSLSKYYFYEMNKIYHTNKYSTKEGFNLSKWKQLINYDYTISNIEFYINLLKNHHKIFYTTDTINIDDSIKEPDGSIHYPYKVRYISAKEVKIEAISLAKRKIKTEKKFELYTKLFEDFINYLKSNNVKVTLLLPPYNPLSYNLLTQKYHYKTIDNIENYLRKYANKNHIEVEGSYNPNKYNLKLTDFSDGIHGHEEVFKKIFNYK